MQLLLSTINELSILINELYTCPDDVHYIMYVVKIMWMNVYLAYQMFNSPWGSI